MSLRRRIRPERKKSIVDRLLRNRKPQDIWSIEPDDKNLQDSIAEADNLLCTEAMHWFSEIGEAGNVMNILEHA